jgi:serine protease Do
MSDEIAREPCPRCGEPAPLAARACPHCKGNLLVDIAVAGHPSEGRVRYQMARALSALGPPAPAFAAAQQAMAIPGSIVVSGVTRDFAHRVLEVFEDHGARARTTAAVQDVGVPDEAPATRLSSVLVIGILLALAGFGLYAWIRHLGAGDEVDIPTRKSARAVVPQGPALNTQEIASRVTPSAVMLRCRSSLGTGFFVARDLALTNAHVLCPADDSMRAVFANGREIAATVEQRDDWLDLALVRVPDAKADPLPLGDATALRTGDHVVFIGTPQGLEFTVHEGIVSHKARSLFGVAFLQIDGNVNPGNSGGPLLDMHGRVVGVVSAKLNNAEGLGFVLPINYAYSGEPHLLQPPLQPKPDEESWRNLLAETASADHKQVRKLETETPRLALLQLSSPRGEGLYGVVAQRSQLEPPAETLTFTFRNAERILCRVNATAEHWQKATGSDPSQAGSESRYMQWLKKNNLEGEVFIGAAPLSLKDCPLEDLRAAGTEVILEGADDRANRVAL